MIKNPKSSALSKFNPIALSHNKIIESKSKKSWIVAGAWIEPLKNVKSSIDASAAIATTLLNSLDSKTTKKLGIPQVTSLKLNTLKTLFDNYEYKNIQEHKVLKEALSKYHVALKANKEISIFKTYSTPIVNKEPETINFINIFLQLQGMITAIHCSIMNNHVEVAEKLFIDILSKANLIYSQYEFQIHKAYTNTLFELVNHFISWSMEIKLLKI